MKNRKEDIVFVINPSLWGQSMYPTGILCLSGFLETAGFPNTIIDSRLAKRLDIDGPSRERLVREWIRGAAPKLVCFSSTHREFAEVTRLNEMVKQTVKGVTTIVGGSQPTYRVSDFLENGFDFVCRGEGEKTLRDFCVEVFNARRRWETVRGLCWNNGASPVCNPDRELLTEEELNEVDVLPYDKLDSRYFELNLMTIRGMPLRGALLLTTRGCPFSCSYCGCNLIFGRKLRFRSPENIEKEVTHLKQRLGVEGLWIVDDTFTVDKAHCLAVAAILKKHAIVWGCQSRVDTIDEEMMRQMRHCGCIQIDFGVESGSQRILDEIICKRTNIAQVIAVFRLVKKYGIRTLANFMVGLPTESYEDLALTYKVAREIDADAYVFSIATPLPGTRLYEMVNEEITPEQYASLDWNGSDFTEKLNKSGIRDLVGEREKLYRKFLGRMMIKSFLSRENYRFYLRSSNKYRRFIFILKALCKYAGKLLS